MKLDNQWKKDSDDPEVTFKTAPLQTPNGEMSPAAEDQSCMDQWVECDDESIRMYSEEEFVFYRMFGQSILLYFIDHIMDRNIG